MLFVESGAPESSRRRALLIDIVRGVSVGGLNCRRRCWCSTSSGSVPKRLSLPEHSYFSAGAGPGLWEDYPPIRMGRVVAPHWGAAPCRDQGRLGDDASLPGQRLQALQSFGVCLGARPR